MTENARIRAAARALRMKFGIGSPTDAFLERAAIDALAAADAVAPVEAELFPAESMALTVALAQIARLDVVPPNTTAVLVWALARLVGREIPKSSAAAALKEDPAVSETVLCGALHPQQVYSHHAYGELLPAYARFVGEDEPVPRDKAITIYVACQREAGHSGKHLSAANKGWAAALKEDQ